MILHFYDEPCIGLVGAGDTPLTIMLYLRVVMYNMKTWKQEFLVMVYIFCTTALRYTGVNATWPITGDYYMVSLLALFCNSLSRRWLVGFLRRNLTMHREFPDSSITMPQTGGITSP